MELIDKEAVLHKIGQMPTAWEYGQAVKDIYEMIKNEPVADAAPVVHGRWDDLEDAEVCSVKCSNCGEVLPEWYSDFNYCPNCGARMDGTELDD